ncbi:hypothetical protein [Cypionkella sp. TWP1-2-1b2]|uniref:hypothetical protein n=1 Tax=Cypionkella sp. TWP1-2-1b2 TaxID=2804675 RepID=UPI003CFA3187
MTDAQLIRSLQSIGMACFVAHLPLFANTKLSNETIAATLNHSFTAKASRSRTSHARAILRAGRLADALELISTARVPTLVQNQARSARNALG